MAQSTYKAVVESPRGVFIYESEGKPVHHFLDSIKQLHTFDLFAHIKMHQIKPQTALAVPMVL